MDRKDPITIRKAHPGDLKAMGRMGASLVRAHHAMDTKRFFIWKDLEQGYAWWLGKELKNRKAVLLVAVKRDRVIGYAYGRMEPRDWNLLRDNCGVGVDLVVEPRSRGAGIGGRLGEELIRALLKKGAPLLVLHVAAKNRKAQKLFRKMGFRPTLMEMAREG